MKRMFPSYTTEDLKAAVLTETNVELRAKLEAEIAARASGASKVLITPQVAWSNGNMRPVVIGK